ncbi:unnamed protein product [Dibothriocephalus latus]|uniref:Uncharacterized protein n=1 Tax=Dibothriocephalus latus TaxID=60516 RepID=A0A3P7MY48_DIBLA|nr:unnamed protein product [Dibothriocephalus latus]
MTLRCLSSSPDSTTLHRKLFNGCVEPEVIVRNVDFFSATPSTAPLFIVGLFAIGMKFEVGASQASLIHELPLQPI